MAAAPAGPRAPASAVAISLSVAARSRPYAGVPPASMARTGRAVKVAESSRVAAAKEPRASARSRGARADTAPVPSPASSDWIAPSPSGRAARTGSRTSLNRARRFCSGSPGARYAAYCAACAPSSVRVPAATRIVERPSGSGRRTSTSMVAWTPPRASTRAAKPAGVNASWPGTRTPSRSASAAACAPGRGEAQGVAEGRGAEAGDIDAQVRGDEHAGGAIAVRGGGEQGARRAGAGGVGEGDQHDAVRRGGAAGVGWCATAAEDQPAKQAEHEQAGQGHPAVPNLLGAACLAERAVGVAGGPAGRCGGHGAGGEDGGGLQPALGEQDRTGRTGAIGWATPPATESAELAESKAAEPGVTGGAAAGGSSVRGRNASCTSSEPPGRGSPKRRRPMRPPLSGTARAWRCTARLRPVPDR